MTVPLLGPLAFFRYYRVAYLDNEDKPWVLEGKMPDGTLRPLGFFTERAGAKAMLKTLELFEKQWKEVFKRLAGERPAS